MGKKSLRVCRETMKMSEHTFHILCSELRPHIQKQSTVSTVLRDPISVERRVAVTVEACNKCGVPHSFKFVWAQVIHCYCDCHRNMPCNYFEPAQKMCMSQVIRCGRV